MGRSKKDKSVEEDECRPSHVFGFRSSKPMPASPASTNPYARQNVTVDPYAQSNMSNPSTSIYVGSIGTPLSTNSSRTTSIVSQPPPYEKGSDSSPRDSKGAAFNAGVWRPDNSPMASHGYGSVSNSRYHNLGGSGSSGYGSERFNTASDASSSTSTLRPGGYGGLGRSSSQDTTSTDAGREALFGDARERLQRQQAHDGLAQEERDKSGVHDDGTGFEGGYGTQRDRQLTAEEAEEEDVQATKQQIKFIKQQDVSSTRNALRIAAQAEETGRETLERLGAQGERIHNTERNLDLAANQNRLAEEKAKELKHLTRSMFAVKIDNPFTKTSRKQERDQIIMNTHHAEREQREATRAAAFESQARHQTVGRGLRGPSGKTKKSNLAERSKYQFEADSDDEAMEEEIDNNLDALAGATARLNQLGRAMGREVDIQNKHIDRIAEKVDRVDDQIVMNRARLDRIK